MGALDLERQTGKSDALRDVLFLGTLAVAALAVYWAGLRGPYYSDDLYFVFRPASDSLLYHFFHGDPNSHAYRPVELTILAAIQNRFGLETLPVHALALVLHAALCALVLTAARVLGLPVAQRYVAAAFLMFHQVNALAVFSNDTLSQLLSTLFGFASVLMLYAVQMRGGGRRWYWLSVIALAVSLFAKESGIAFFPILAAVCFAAGSRSWTVKGLAATGRQVLPWAATILLYLAVRAMARAGGQPEQQGDYPMSISTNIVRNLALWGFAVANPVSTIRVFLASKSGALALAGLAAALSLLMVVAVFVGTRIGRRGRLSLALLACGMTTMFPAVLLKQISELYVYNSMPFVALVYGVGLGALMGSGWPRWTKVTIAALVAVILAVHVSGLQDKAALMVDNGERARAYLREISRYAPELPAGGTVVLVNPAESSPEYSVFLVNGFNVLKYGNRYIGPRLLGRPDIRVHILDPADSEGLPQGGPAIVLALDSERRVVRAGQQPR